MKENIIRSKATLIENSGKIKVFFLLRKQQQQNKKGIYAEKDCNLINSL